MIGGWRNVRRNRNTSIGTRGLKIKEIKKGDIAAMPKNAVRVSLKLGEGVTTENVNLYRYIRFKSYQEIRELIKSGNLEPNAQIPLEDILSEILKNVEEDVESMIFDATISVLNDRELIIYGE